MNEAKPNQVRSAAFPQQRVCACVCVQAHRDQGQDQTNHRGDPTAGAGLRGSTG